MGNQNTESFHFLKLYLFYHLLIIRRIRTGYFLCNEDTRPPGIHKENEMNELNKNIVRID